MTIMLKVHFHYALICLMAALKNQIYLRNIYIACLINFILIAIIIIKQICESVLQPFQEAVRGSLYTCLNRFLFWDQFCRTWL